MTALPRLALLLALVHQQSDPARETRELVEKLRSDQVDERDEAARKLHELGKAALPELEKAAKSTDAEIRARIKAIVEEIARRERVKAVRPASTRLTIELNDVPFPEAAGKVFGAFGMTAIAWTPDLEKKRVSVRLEKATLWEALDAFCGAAKVTVESNLGLDPWKFSQGSPGDSLSKVDSGDLRIRAHEDGSKKTGDGPWKNSLSVRVLLPPGTWASSLQVEGGSVSDQEGRPIEFGESQEWSEDREPGKPTLAHVWRALIHPEKLKSAKSLQIKGTLVLRFPHDLQRFEFDLRTLKVPLKPKIPGVDLTLNHCGTNEDWPGRWELNVNAQGGLASETFLAIMEDAEGRWLFDAGHFTIDPGGSMGQSSSSPMPKGAKPARLVLYRVRGEDETRIPFVLSKIPLPHPPPEEKK